MGSKVREVESKKPHVNSAVPAMTNHDRMREQLARDVESFLSHGGHITHLEPHVRSGYLNDGDQDGF